MFWDNVAGVYDIFVNVINRRTHHELRRIVAGLIGPQDRVLECACGTGMLTSVIAGRCRAVTATDYAPKMLKRAEKNCAGYGNITFRQADITSLDFPDGAFDKVVAGNVIHLLDEPMKALRELDRVCAPGGLLIIPTYMNKDDSVGGAGFSSAVDKAGADFRHEFTVDSYRQFFISAGYGDVKIEVADGRIPCAVAVTGKRGA